MPHKRHNRSIRVQDIPKRLPTGPKSLQRRSQRALRQPQDVQEMQQESFQGTSGTPKSPKEAQEARGLAELLWECERPSPNLLKMLREVPRAPKVATQEGPRKPKRLKVLLRFCGSASAHPQTYPRWHPRWPQHNAHKGIERCQNRPQEARRWPQQGLRCPIWPKMNRREPEDDFKMA